MMPGLDVLISNMIQTCIFNQHIQKRFYRRNLIILVSFVPKFNEYVLRNILSNIPVDYIAKCYRAKGRVILFEKHFKRILIVLFKLLEKYFIFNHSSKSGNEQVQTDEQV